MAMILLFSAAVAGNAATLVSILLFWRGNALAGVVSAVFAACSLLVSAIAAVLQARKPLVKVTTFRELDPDDARHASFLHGFNNCMCGILGPVSLMQYLIDTEPGIALKDFREELAIIKAQAEKVQTLVSRSSKPTTANGQAKTADRFLRELAGTALIVDDDLAIRVVTGDIVRLCGLTADFAESGKRAVELINKTAYDLVILDFDMPVMDGRQAFPLLKKANPEVKIIVTSGYSRESVLDGAVLMNADAFIQKPFNLEQVAETLRSVMSRKRAIS